MASGYTSIQEFLMVLRRGRWIVLAMVLLGGGVAYGLSERADPVYRAEASLACRPPTQSVELIGLLTPRDQTPEERAAVCAEQAGRQSNLEPVKEKLKLPDSLESLDANFEARTEARTNLVVLTVEDGDPVRAAAIANELARSIARSERRSAQRRFDDLIDTSRSEYRRALRGEADNYTRFRRRALEEQLAKIEAARDFTRPIEISERATPNATPVSPKKVRNTLLGAAGGLLLGIMLAFLRHGLDRRLRGAREIEREAGLPMLGSVRKSALGKTNFGNPEGLGDDEQDLEAFRILYTNLLYMDVDNPPRRILVTSALPEEGKSTVASSLAVAAGLAGQRVLLIEADLRRPVLAKWLELDSSPGLVDYLAGSASPPEVIRGRALAPAAGNGAGDSEQEPRVLSTIVAGKPPPRPAELLNSRRFADFAAVLSRSYDLVIFDSPPLLPVTDALDLVAHSDAVLLCVRAGKTTRDQLKAATDALSRLPERPTGYVVTGVTQESEGDYGYHRYSYGRAD